MTVSEVKEKVLRTLDDDFAKTLGEFERLEALRAEARKGLEARRERENRARPRGGGGGGSARRAPVPGAGGPGPPPGRPRHRARARARFAARGWTPTGCPWDYKKMLEEMRPGAERAVRRTLLLEAIAEQEGLTPPTPTWTRRSSASPGAAGGRRRRCGA